MRSSSLNEIDHVYSPKKASCIIGLRFIVLANFVSTQQMSWVPGQFSCLTVFLFYLDNPMFNFDTTIEIYFQLLMTGSFLPVLDV